MFGVFWIYSSGFRVKDQGFRVWDLEFRVYGLISGFRVQCLGFSNQGLGSSLIEGLRVVQGLVVVPVFLYRYSMTN